MIDIANLVGADKFSLLVKKSADMYINKAQDIIFRAQQEIDRLVLYEGISRQEAVNIVTARIKAGDELIRPALTSFDRFSRTAVSETIRLPGVWAGQEAPEDLWYWDINSVEHCPDCIKMEEFTRDGKTLDEIEAMGFGFPGEAKTKCKHGCLCILKPV